MRKVAGSGRTSVQTITQDGVDEEDDLFKN